MKYQSGLETRWVGVIWLGFMTAVLQGCGVSQGIDVAVEEAVEDEPEREYFTLGNLEIMTKEGLWEAAEGVLPQRMAGTNDVGRYTVYRSVWKHPDGDRLVCLQYPGAELFGTPYDITVFDRDLNVIKQGQITASQDATPYCIALAKSSTMQMLEGVEERWRLVVGFWSGGSPYEDALTRLQESEGPMDFADEPHGFHFALPTWDGQGEPRGQLDDDKFPDFYWIEPNVNLLVIAEPNKRDPSSYRLPRNLVETRLAGWLRSPDTSRVGEALQLILEGGVQSPEHRESVTAVLKEALGHESAWLRRFAGEALLTMHGKTACADLVALTSEPDADVRAYATMALILSKDPMYIDAITTGCKGLADHDEAKVIVWALEQWQDTAVVPALIQLLGDPNGYDSSFFTTWWEQLLVDDTYQDWGNAALQAQRALLDLTGVAFPFDQEEAMDGWAKASALPPAQRQAQLSARFPDAYRRADLRLTAEIGEQGGTRLTVHNPSRVSAWLSSRPSSVQVGLVQGRASRWGGHGGDTDLGLIEIPPKGSFSFTLPIHDHVPKPNRVRIEYEGVDDPKGVIVWRGDLEADVKQTTPDEPAADGIRRMFEGNP